MTFCILPLRSQETTTKKITSIEITGLKRTKPHVAQYPLEIFLGRDGSTLDLDEVKAVVVETGNLEPKTIELIETEEGMVLHVTVNEKWTIFPFPFFMATSGETNFGLFLTDFNFLGLRDQAALGGMYGTSRWMAMAMYNHTPDRKGRPGWSTFFSYNRGDQTDTDREEVVHRRYSSVRIRSAIGLQYPLTDFLSGGASISYTGISLYENEKDFNPPENDAVHVGFSPRLSLQSKSDWDGIFLSRQILSLEYGFYYGISGSSYHQAGISGVFERSVIPGFRFYARSGAVWKSTENPLFEDGPSRAQVDILPRNFSARNYAGFSAGFEKSIFTIRWGTLSILSSWQFAFSQGSIPGLEFDNGPSGGLRFYLSRLALPAMGFTFAYNMNTRLYQFAINAGASL